MYLVLYEGRRGENDCEVWRAERPAPKNKQRSRRLPFKFQAGPPVQEGGPLTERDPLPSLNFSRWVDVCIRSTRRTQGNVLV